MFVRAVIVVCAMLLVLSLAHRAFQQHIHVLDANGNDVTEQYRARR